MTDLPVLETSEAEAAAQIVDGIVAAALVNAVFQSLSEVDLDNLCLIAALLRRWPSQDAPPLPAEIEAAIERIQARPGADWDRETVALLRRWPKQDGPLLPEEVQAVFDDIDVIFAEAFLEDTRADFGRSAEQALRGFEKIVALLRRLGAPVLPEKVEAMVKRLEEPIVHEAIRQSSIGAGDRLAHRVADDRREAAALLRRWPRQSDPPLLEEVEAMAKSLEEQAWKGRAVSAECAERAAALLRRWPRQSP